VEEEEEEPEAFLRPGVFVGEFLALRRGFVGDALPEEAPGNLSSLDFPFVDFDRLLGELSDSTSSAPDGDPGGDGPEIIFNKQKNAKRERRCDKKELSQKKRRRERLGSQKTLTEKRKSRMSEPVT
jgi:hypothetical protein